MGASQKPNAKPNAGLYLNLLIFTPMKLLMSWPPVCVGCVDDHRGDADAGASLPCRHARRITAARAGQAFCRGCRSLAALGAAAAAAACAAAACGACCRCAAGLERHGLRHQWQPTQGASRRRPSGNKHKTNISHQGIQATVTTGLHSRRVQQGSKVKVHRSCQKNIQVRELEHERTR